MSADTTEMVERIEALRHRAMLLSSDLGLLKSDLDDDAYDNLHDLIEESQDLIQSGQINLGAAIRRLMKK